MWLFKWSNYSFQEKHNEHQNIKESILFCTCSNLLNSSDENVYASQSTEQWIEFFVQWKKWY